MRLLSKADKHVSKLEQTANTAKMLNRQVKDVGKLSLPTLSNIEQAVKGCHVSSLDFKNQFFSIELHPESKPKTNFFYENQIYMHDRLPRGISSSPYIASSLRSETPC